MVEETGSATLLSGLGKLHIEVVVDRLQREHGLAVWIGKPSVAYRETVQSEIDTGGLVEYDRTVGSTRMQAQVHIRLESLETEASSDVAILTDPDVKLGSKVKEYLGFDEDDEELELTQRCEVAKALIAGCKGALKRGPLGSFELANVRCYVEEIDSEGGLAGLKAMPGTIRAAVSSIVATTLQNNKDSCSLLEPTMSVEVSAPSEMVGTVLSDLTARRGNVGEVIMGDDDALHSKALIHGQVPLKEILGYANNLRSITGGEGSFSAEYKGHSPCDSA
jgi:elongation factor G